MKTNNYKYVVSIETNIHAKTEDWEEPLSSNSEQIEFSANNLLEARKKALDKAENLEDFFEEQPHPIYPSEKWNTIFGVDKSFIMLYQIKVYLKGENENLCIYDDGDGLNDEETNMEIFKNLLKEYELFEKLGIDTSHDEELVIVKDWGKFVGWENKEKTEAHILENGMAWKNPNFLERITEEDLDFFDDDTVKNGRIKDSQTTKTNKKIDYKTTSIHRIKINHDNIEISVKTTSEIPKEIQNELLALIDKWKNL